MSAPTFAPTFAPAATFSDAKALRDVTVVSSVLSIFGSLSLILLLVAYHVRHKDNPDTDADGAVRWKPIQREMLLSLSICDLLTSCLYLIRVSK